MKRQNEIVHPNLHDVIKKKYGSYKVAAELAGIGTSCLQRIVSGKTVPRVSTIKALEELTGKPAEFLFAYTFERGNEYKVLYRNLYKLITEHNGVSEFSKETGIDRKSVIMIMAGIQDVKKSTIDKILEVAEEPYEWIFEEGE